MVRFYKTASGRRRYNRYRRYRRWYKRKYRRFANGTSRSRVRVKVPVQFNVALSVPAGSTESNVMTICPFYNNSTATAGTLSEAAVRGGLSTSQLFINYGNLYDSFKVDGMKVAVSITSPVGAGQGAFPSLSVYTAWDRKFERNDFDTAAHYPTVANMRTSSSFLASTAVNNSITKLKRSCYASDLLEKASFIDCHGTNLANQQIAGVAAQTLQAFTTSAAGAQLSNPAFCPGFMFGVDTGSSIDAQNARPVTLVVEVMYYVTFRNPKYGAAASAAKIDAIERSVDFGDLDDDGDMDAPPPPPAAATQPDDVDDDVIIDEGSRVRDPPKNVRDTSIGDPSVTSNRLASAAQAQRRTIRAAAALDRRAPPPLN